MTRGLKLYNMTHTLPIREGFFYCAYNGNSLNCLL
nr:MAG TPA: hypothetical protein [Caudoviricetes sp.]